MTPVSGAGSLAPLMVSVFSRVSIDEIFSREAGHGQGHAIGVLARALDIIRGIGGSRLRARALVEQGKQAVEADGRAIQRGEIEVTHDMSS